MKYDILFSVSTLKYLKLTYYLNIPLYYNKSVGSKLGFFKSAFRAFILSKSF
jgi:hypothetical protein